jgi:DNA-binding LytR/AlgR family response regulator
MRAIILEDEIIAKNRLVRLLEEVDSSIEIIASFETVRDLAEYLITHEHPEILFLDIQVADGTSFELFDILEVKAHVIFTTAYSEFAIEAFKKNALHYLLKPIKKVELEESLDRAKKIDKSSVANLQQSRKSFNNRFLIKFGIKLYNVATSDIAYIYSNNKISYFVTKDGNRIPSDYKLQHLEERLNAKNFFRVNRQFIVHADNIAEILVTSRSRIELRLEPMYNGKIIISTERTPMFKKWLRGE